jgi:small subunit ribosomal protein S2
MASTLSARTLLETACTCLRPSAAKGKGRISISSLHTSSKKRQQDLAAGSAASDSDELLQGNLPDQIQSLEQEAGGEHGGQEFSEEEWQVRDRRRRMALSERTSRTAHLYQVSDMFCAVSSLESVGSAQTRSNTWQPHHSLSRSHSPASLTLSHLLASTAHLGHSTTLGSPQAYPYIVGTRHGVSIIDVRETLTALRRASNLVRSTVENDGLVLFLGGSGIKNVDKVLQKNAAKLGRNGYAAGKWMPGTLTNAIKLYSDTTSLIQRGISLQKEEDGDDGEFSKNLNPTNFHPSLLILFSPLTTPHALREADSLNVPTIALCDTNVDPRHFTYPIPANDDSMRVVELISGVLAEAGKEGINRREAKAAAQRAAQRQYGLQNAFESQQYRPRIRS